MKRAYILVLALFIMSIVVPFINIPVYAAPTQFIASTASDDSYVDDGHVNTNYDEADFVRVQGALFGDTMRIFLDFDLSALPLGGVVLNATLHLYQTDSSDSDAGRFYTVTQDWDETTLTWANQPTTGAYETITLDQTSGWVSFNVTDVVNLAENYGFMIRLGNEGPAGNHYHIYADSELGISYDPWLEIYYTPAPTLSDFEAPDSTYGGNWFWINVTVTDPTAIAEIDYVSVEIEDSIILNWTQSSDVFAEQEDPSNYCSINASTSFSTAIDAVSVKLHWYIALTGDYLAGWTDVKVEDTIAAGDSGAWDSFEEEELFYFLTDILVINRLEVTNLEGCGNWTFADTQYYTIELEAASGVGWDTLNTLEVRFSDGVHIINMAYDHDDDAWYLLDGSDVSVLGLGEVEYDDIFMNVTFQIYLNSRIIDALNVTLFAGYSFGEEATTWSYNVTDYFSIYNLGGHAVITSYGIAGRVIGGDVFELYSWANDTVSETWAYSEVIYRRLQHFSAAVDLRFPYHFSALSITSDGNPYQGFWMYGVDFCLNDTWYAGWSANITVSEFVISEGDQYLLYTVEWRYNDVLIRTDGNRSAFLTGTPDEQNVNDGFQIKLDFWFNKINASSTVGGRVTSQVFGITDSTPWWVFWESNWGPTTDFEHESYFAYDLLVDDNITSCREIVLMKVWSNVSQTYTHTLPDEGFNISARNFVDMRFITQREFMEGIDTPSAPAPKLPDEMPLSGMWAPIIGSLRALSASITRTFSPFVTLFVGLLDEFTAALGFPGAASALMNALEEFYVMFTLALADVLSILVTITVAFTSFLGFFVDAISGAITIILQIITIVSAILSGTHTIATGLGDIWALIAIDTWAEAIPLLAIISWFVSLDTRARRGRKYGKSWMSVLFEDIRAIMAVSSYVIDISFRIINFVLDGIFKVIMAIKGTRVRK